MEVTCGHDAPHRAGGLCGPCHYAANRERILAEGHAAYVKKRAERLAKQRAYYVANAERLKAYQVVYRLANLEKVARTKSAYAQRRSYKAHRGPCCERCGFVPEDPCQLDVDHIDGDHSNNDPANLQTLCANCHRLKSKQDRWLRIRARAAMLGGHNDEGTQDA